MGVFKLVTVSVSEAKKIFSFLLTLAESGKDVVITRYGAPVARIVRLRGPNKRMFGSMAGQIELSDDFFDPLPEDELALWESP